MNKVVDGLLGFAIGDAMGVPIEFIPREKLLKHPVTKMLCFSGREYSDSVPSGLRYLHGI